MGTFPYLWWRTSASPDIDEILKLLIDFKNNYPSKTLIEIKTNGYDPNVVKKIQYLSSEVLIINTNKTNRFQKKFEPFNLALRDKKKNFFTNFSNCCWVSAYCGIGLNKFGYYPCATAGGIDRVAGFDIGLKNLPLDRKLIYKQAKILCVLCGHFTFRKFRSVNNRTPVIGEPKSKTWIYMYQKYEKNIPKLTSY